MSQSLFDSVPPPATEPANDAPYTMRAPCKKCGSVHGAVTETGAQDVVRCVCGAFQYNAPRVETGKKVRTTRTVHKGITAKIRARVLERANRHCELCGKSADVCALHVGHLLSVDAGMARGFTEIELNDEENLCSMCDECNLGLGKEPVSLRFVVALLMARLRRVG